MRLREELCAALGLSFCNKDRTRVVWVLIDLMRSTTGSPRLLGAPLAQKCQCCSQKTHRRYLQINDRYQNTITHKCHCCSTMTINEQVNREQAGYFYAHCHCSTLAGRASANTFLMSFRKPVVGVGTALIIKAEIRAGRLLSVLL